MRERLVDACWQCLVQAPATGAGVSVAAVCDAAACTPPTLYHHFGKLEDLQRTACERAFEVWAQTLDQAIAAQTSPAERLRQRGRAYVEWGVRHPAAYRVLFLTPPPGTVRSTRPGNGFEPVVADVAQILELEPDDPLVLTAAFAHWSAAHGVTSMVIANPDLPDGLWEGILDQLHEALIALHRRRGR